MTKKKAKTKKRVVPKSKGLREPFKRWRYVPLLVHSARRYVDHPWLADPQRIKEFLEDDISEPEIAWYFELSSDTDPGTVMKRKYTPWTSAEEQTVFLRYNYFRREASMAFRKAHASKTGDYSPAKPWEDKVLGLQSIIAAKNLGLVLSMCSRQLRGGSEIWDGDLVGEGNAALLRAIDLFDFAYGWKFSTYACRAVIKSLIRYRQRQQKIASREVASYSPDSYFEPSYTDTNLGHDEESYRMERMKKSLEENTADLNQVELEILMTRFGFQNEDGTNVTLVKVGQKFGLTKERVRQIQNQALARLRAVLKED